MGEVKLPVEAWLRDLGRVDEATKVAVLVGAAAMIQLSTHESLSLVALEAWRQKTPVIVHRDCTVLAGQIERSGGGATVCSFEEFAALLDDLLTNGAAWRQRGANGRRYVDTHYSSREKYVGALLSAIEQMRQAIDVQMRKRGPARAAEFARQRWQQRFAEFVENVLTQPARAYRQKLVAEPLRNQCHAAHGSRTLLVPVRIRNAGTHAASGDGPGRCVICSEIRADADGAVVVPRDEVPLPATLDAGGYAGRRHAGGDSGQRRRFSHRSLDGITEREGYGGGDAVDRGHGNRAFARRVCGGVPGCGAGGVAASASFDHVAGRLCRCHRRAARAGEAGHQAEVAQ